MPKIQQQDQITNLKFLRIVKKFPEIYNPSHDLANDKAHSMVVWEKISCELDTPVNALKKKWQKLCSMHKKKFISNNETSNHPSSSKDEIFHLMSSMLKIPGVYYPCDTDDGSISSAPTLSIISEEGGNRSTRSSSSSSSTLVGDGEDRPGEEDNPKSFEKENGSPPSLSQAMAAVPSSSSYSYSYSSSSVSSGNKINANFSTRVLRSHNKRLNRTTRSGPPEITVKKNFEKDSKSNLSRLNTRSNLTKTRYSISSVNRDKNIKRSNETIGKFFQNLAITLAKFPNNLRNDARIKISKIVNDAEIELKSLSSNSI